MMNSLTICLATRGRPQLLRDTLARMLSAIRNKNTKVVVVVDEDDAETVDAEDDILNLFAEWEGCGRLVFGNFPRPDSLGEKYNRGFAAHPADVYLAAVDYWTVLTDGFDERILEAAATYPDGICAVLNQKANLSFSGLNAATAKMVELMNGFYSEGYPFWWLDHDFEDVAWMANRVAYVDVEIDTSRRPGTQNRRDVAFWAEVFTRTESAREATALRIINRMTAPEWHKRALIRNIPLVHQRSRIINRMAVQQTAGQPEVPDDERHQRLRRKANEMLAASGQEPILIPPPEAQPRHPLSVLLAIPNYSMRVAQEFSRSVAGTLTSLVVNGIPVGIVDEPANAFIDFARNKLATIFDEERTQFENLLFIDDDLGWEPTAVFRLLMRPEPIVLGIYPKKEEPEAPLKFPIDLDKDENGKLIASADGQLIKVRRIAGAGFMRIKRWVVEAFRERYGTFLDGHSQPDGSFKSYIEMFRAGVVEGQQQGEDKVFVNRCEEMGIEIWCDPSLEFTHRGEWVWKGRLADIFLDRPPEEQQATPDEAA